MTNLVCGYADVGRSGLGNMLFPWARCVLWCQRHGATVLRPRWLRFRIGPFLRREHDKRLYHRLFRPHGISHHAKRLACMIALPWYPEPSSTQTEPIAHGVYVFRGMGACFAPLLGHHDRIRSELTSMVRAGQLPETPTEAFAAIHVRRGDFTSPSAGGHELTTGQHNYRIPLLWYVEALRALRAGSMREVPALVFSDGDEHELRELLAEPGTRFVRGGSAISQMFTMAHASALVASGSTFSMWAAYLGQVPTIWFPGQRRESVLASDDGFELQPEWAAGPMSGRFLREVDMRMR